MLLYNIGRDVKTKMLTGFSQVGIRVEVHAEHGQAHFNLLRHEQRGNASDERLIAYGATVDLSTDDLAGCYIYDMAKLYCEGAMTPLAWPTLTYAFLFYVCNMLPESDKIQRQILDDMPEAKLLLDSWASSKAASSKSAKAT
jgi:hypothetical protein